MFKFIPSTPIGGDGTCGYVIDLDKEYTVGSLISTILTAQKREWGYIGIYKEHSIFGVPSCQYADGELTTNTLPEDVLNMKVLSVSASGGWSRMDYLLKIER